MLLEVILATPFASADADDERPTQMTPSEGDVTMQNHPMRAIAPRSTITLIRRQLGVAGAALLLAGAPLCASATTQIGFMPPAAQIQVADRSTSTSTYWRFHDLGLFRSCGDPSLVRYVVYENQAGYAAAQAGKADDHWAAASGSDYGGGLAAAAVLIRNSDPRDRGTIKLKVEFKAHAKAGPEPVGFPPVTSANYQLMIAYLSRTPTAKVAADGCTVESAEWIEDVIQKPAVFEVLGYEYKYMDLQGEVHSSSRVQVYDYGQQTGETTQSSDPMNATVEVASNRGVVMLVRASAGGGGVSAIDPIVTVHPDNPDVQIEIVAPDGPTGRGPLDRFTAEELAARGIDPQPFINLGFLAPATPSDTVAPSTAATPSPTPNANGWNNVPVKVDLAAADNAGGSGVKEIRIALAGPTTDSRVAAGSSATVDIAAEGETSLTYFAVDNAGNQESAKTLTVRIDKTPPSLSGLPASGCTLWPPDHRLVQVASVTATDGAAGSAGFALDVTSSEPETGTGDGDVGPDVSVTGGVVQVRAERAGNGAGRVYTIKARATDRAGNVANATSTCVVPHDRK